MYGTTPLRAGDPHQHLHLQVNARVFAGGAWRGLHSVGVVDSIEAINGIGHAVVACDPGFRQALVNHGYTLDTQSGEITQLSPCRGAFSARADQITRNLDRLEATWRTDHPGDEPGPKLRQGWDRRAWAQARPDKVVPENGNDLNQRWVDELRELGFTPPLTPTPVLDPVHRSCGAPWRTDRTTRPRRGGRPGAVSSRRTQIELEQRRHPW